MTKANMSNSAQATFKDATAAVIALYASAEKAYAIGSATVSQAFSMLCATILRIHADDVALGSPVASLLEMFSEKEANASFKAFKAATITRLIGARPRAEDGNGEDTFIVNVWRARYARIGAAILRATEMHKAGIRLSHYDASTGFFIVPLSMFDRAQMTIRASGKNARPTVALDNKREAPIVWIAKPDATPDILSVDKLMPTMANLFTLQAVVAKKRSTVKPTATPANATPVTPVTPAAPGAAPGSVIVPTVDGSANPSPHDRGGAGYENVRAAIIAVGNVLAEWKADKKAGPITRQNLVESFGKDGWAALQELAKIVNACNAAEQAPKEVSAPAKTA